MANAFINNRTEPDIYGKHIACQECEFTQPYWEDGLPRLRRREVPPEYRKYADLYHYDAYGEPIWELIVAEHDAKFDRNIERQIARLLRQVAHAPRSTVGRNDPCPCGGTHKAKRHVDTQAYQLGDAGDQPVLTRELFDELAQAA